MKYISRQGGAVIVCLVLIAGIWLGFGQAIGFDFINYDDDLFVYNNSLVTGGLCVSGISKAFFSMDQVFYYPLTLVSFMLDATVYGMNPFGFHLTNILLHSATAFLLWFVFFKMTDSFWCSALLAAFFALHPLRVESVVWITARKDVLSGFFFMLILWAYSGYARGRFSWVRYLTVTLLYLAGLMAKPILVSVPVILLLMDAWPLKRFPGVGFYRLFLEKIPLFLLSGMFCVITLQADTSNSQLVIEDVSMFWRVGNGVVSYVVYIWTMLVPAGLTLPYPAHPVSIPAFLGALAFLLVISVFVLCLRKRMPYLVIGWFWYLIMLLPVLGIVRVLGTARADRFTYLPHIGLCLAVVWGISDWCRTDRRRRVAGLLVGVLLVGLISVTARQTMFWRNSEALWSHSLACTRDNFIAHSNLGAALVGQGRTEEAIHHFEKAIRCGARQANVFNNLAFALAAEGRHKEALTPYVTALSIAPEHPEIMKNFADSLGALGKVAEAVRLYESVLQKNPEYDEVLVSLAWIYATDRRTRFQDGERAVTLAEQAVELTDGRDLQVGYTLAAAYARAGRFSEAVSAGRKVRALSLQRENASLAEWIQEQIDLYERRIPYCGGPLE